MKKVWSFGDSLSLPRPKVVGNEERYISLLRNTILDVDGTWAEHQHANYTSADTLSWICHEKAYYEEYLETEKLDLAIVHIGICDCAPRPIPAWLRNAISKFPNLPRKVIVWVLHKMRPFLIRVHAYKTVPSKAFRANMSSIINILKGFSSKVLVINIAPTTQTMEKHSPHWNESIIEYNKIIKDLCLESNEAEVNQVDFWEFLVNNCGEDDSKLICNDLLSS